MFTVNIQPTEKQLNKRDEIFYLILLGYSLIQGLFIKKDYAQKH